jgi:hypothetical protein
MPWYEDAGCRNPCGMEPMGCPNCQERGVKGDFDEREDLEENDEYDEREDLEENDDDDDEREDLEENDYYDQREDLETPLGDELGGE